MTIAAARALLDEHLFSTTTGFAEEVEFKEPGDDEWICYPAKIDTRIRAIWDENSQQMVNMEELVVLVRKSDLDNLDGFECRRQSDRGVDHERYFKFSHEIESEKPTRYRAIFTRRLLRFAGVRE